MNELIRDVARITVELSSPINIGSGKGDDMVDSVFVTDANDLPCLPGTSIAGVLRSAWYRTFGKKETEDLFGYQEKDQGARSRIEFSFGVIHASDDKPVKPRMSDKEIESDIVLRAARQQQVRQHVRLNHKGVAADKALFDEAVVSAGHRFTFEVCVIGGDEQVLDRIICLFKEGMVRLGAKTRSGLGELELVRVRRRKFDLTNARDLEAYYSLPTALHIEPEDSVLPAYDVNDAKEKLEEGGDVIAELRLGPVGLWMVGGGVPGKAEEALPAEKKKENKAPDMVPYREGRVRWKEKGKKWQGTFDFEELDVVVPATSLKGALRHRTAYHYNRLNKTFSDKLGTPREIELHDGLNCEGTRLLFGEVLDHKDNKGHAGYVTISDVVVGRPMQKRITHVSLDRFTAGPIDGALFDEAPCYKGNPWTLKIYITRPSEGQETDFETAVKAFGLALKDLVEGRLQIGAGGGRGLGYCQGEIKWSDGGELVRVELGGES